MVEVSDEMDRDRPELLVGTDQQLLYAEWLLCKVQSEEFGLSHRLLDFVYLSIPCIGVTSCFGKVLKGVRNHTAAILFFSLNNLATQIKSRLMWRYSILFA